MNFFKEVISLVLLSLLFCQIGDCYSIRCAGELTLDKHIIPIGSNLTVHCQSNSKQCNRPFIIQLNGQTILRKISCSSVTAQLVVTQPQFSLYCMVEQERKLLIVCGRDIVADLIPSTPSIKKIVFAKGSLSATIHWQVSDDMKLLKPSLRFRIDGTQGWMDGSLAQAKKKKLQMLKNLEPLTTYQFELRVCAVSLKHNCSLWSQTFTQKSPVQAPLSKLDVWRVIMRSEGSTTKNVTVLWKAFTSEHPEADFLGYEFFYKENGTTHTLNCSAAATHYTLQLPVEVSDVNVSAVTSAGNSPPATVMLTNTGRPAPTVYLSQAAGGRIHMVWNSSHLSYSETPEKTLGYVVEWHFGLLEVQWKRIAKDQNSTFINGTPPCTVHISLYVESTEGVSHPAFGQIHMKETSEKWPDKKYSDPHSFVDVPNPALWGSHGGVVIGICLTAAILSVFIINVMYLKCVQQRIRKACISVGPSWLYENLPKLGNSNAIKLLQDEKCGSHLYWQPVDNDPPLSPVEDFSPPVEMKDPYPVVHTEDTTDERKAVKEWTVCPYKPQISLVSQEVEELSEATENEDDEHPWLTFSPDFNKSGEEFFPSQGIHGPLRSCLTVDGTPVSVDVVDGLLILTQTNLDEDMWRVEEDGIFGSKTTNCDESTYKCQTVLPSDLVKSKKETSFNARCYSPQQANTVLHAHTSLLTLQVDEQLL